MSALGVFFAALALMGAAGAAALTMTVGHAVPGAAKTQMTCRSIENDTESVAWEKVTGRGQFKFIAKRTGDEMSFGTGFAGRVNITGDMQTSVLEIYNPTTRDEGSYRCVYRGPHHVESGMALVQLLNLKGPVLTRGACGPDGRLEVSCAATATYRPYVRLRVFPRDGAEVGDRREAAAGLGRTVATQALTVPCDAPTDYAVECAAWLYGTTTRDSTLIVEKSPRKPPLGAFLAWGAAGAAALGGLVGATWRWRRHHKG